MNSNPFPSSITRIRPRGGREEDKGSQEGRRVERDNRRVAAFWMGRLVYRSPLWARCPPENCPGSARLALAGLPGCLATLHHSCGRRNFLSLPVGSQRWRWLVV